MEQPRAAHGHPANVNGHLPNGHPPNGHAHLSNGGGVLMGTKALSNGVLSNGTHGGVPIKQNGGPSEVHNGLNGAPNSHISEGKEPFY